MARTYRRKSNGEFAGGGGGSIGGSNAKVGASVKKGVGPSNAEKVTNAAKMFGTGSKQHLAAQAKFGVGAAKPAAPARSAGSSINGKAASKMSSADKVHAAAVMFGHGSVQHQRAIAKFGGAK